MAGKNRPYLTLDELADELGCTRRDVDAIIARGELPLLRLTPERELVPRMALDAYRRRLRGEPPLTIEVEFDVLFVVKEAFAREEIPDNCELSWIANEATVKLHTDWRVAAREILAAHKKHYASRYAKLGGHGLLNRPTACWTNADQHLCSSLLHNQPDLSLVARST